MTENIKEITSNVIEKKFSSTLNECIVGLSILELFLASTIPMLKIFQAPVELALIFLLFYGCSFLIIKKEDIFLFLLLIFATIFSYIYEDSVNFLITSKNNFLGILTLIYFSSVSFKSKLISPIFLLTTFLIILSIFLPELISPLIGITFNKEFNESRFGGIFFNAHINAYLMGILLIYISRSNFKYGLIGIPILFISGSATMFLSYAGQLVWNFLNKPIFNKAIKKIILIFLAALIFIAIEDYVKILEYFYLYNESHGNRYNSLIVILTQLGETSYYRQLLNPFPSISVQLDQDSYTRFIPKIGDSFHHGANEIGYFGLVNQCGIYLGVGFLVLLLKRARPYSIYILLTLLHYNFILYPIGIYMMIQYSRKN